MASGDESTVKENKEPKNEEVKEEEKKESAVAPLQKYVKHPLQNKWSLWFFKNDKQKSWTENLRTVTSFDTVEDFWAVFNHIQSASKLNSGCDYSLFKDGIEPMWEDARNKNGGRWLLNTNKHQRQSDLDRLWLETLLLLIGEAFGELSDGVNGAVIQIRNKGDKLAIWTDNAKDQEGATRIGQIFKERIGLSPRMHIGYQGLKKEPNGQNSEQIQYFIFLAGSEADPSGGYTPTSKNVGENGGCSKMDTPTVKPGSHKRRKHKHGQRN